MRLQDKVAIVVGGGQTPGDTIGNGRATAILFAREGARLLVVDRNHASAEETCEMIREEGGVAVPLAADVSDEAAVAQIPRACLSEYGRIDILQNNVGIAKGDGGVTQLPRETWDAILGVNLTGMFLTCKHVIPVMREQRAGAVVNISSAAAVVSVGLAAYKVSKAGVNALTSHLAAANFRFGVRVNAIMPGLMDTPMAIQGFAAARGIDTETLRAERSRQIPLRNHIGTAWDTAYASLFLASDEAQFITGVILPVDGGQSVRSG